MKPRQQPSSRSGSHRSKWPEHVPAASIVEALKGVEKNPFSVNHNLPSLDGKDLMSDSVLSLSHTRSKRADSEKGALREDAVMGRRAPPVERKIELDAYSHSTSYRRTLNSLKESGQNPTSVSSSLHVGKPYKTKSSFDFDGNKTAQFDLKQKKFDMYKKLNKIHKREEDLFQETIGIVPAHYLVKHGLFDMIKGKQLDKIMLLLSRMKMQLLGQGFSMWRSHARLLTQKIYGRSALLLQRIARGYIARKRVSKLYKDMLKREKQRNKLNAVAMMNRNYKVTLIQSCIRMRLAYVRTKRKRLIKNSIITIQRFYKYWKYRDASKIKFQKFLLSHRSAKTIQRVWRGNRGRRRAKATICMRNRIQNQERYETREGIFEIYFEQHGAAICIQKWYNSLHFVEDAKNRARAVKREKQLAVQAVKIQKHFRRYLARLIFIRMNIELRLKADYNLRPRQIARIIKAQAAVRRYLIMKENREKFSDILEKREKWKRARELGIISRRRAVRFEHLKIGNLRNISRMERKASLIQRWYKSARVLRIFFGMIRNRRILVADKIVSWYRTQIYRHRVKMSLKVLQPLWRKSVKKILNRKYAQITISRKYRAYCSLKWFREWQRKRNDRARQIQEFVSHRRRRRQLRFSLASARYAAESLESGQQLFHKTKLFYVIDEMNRRIQRYKAPLPKFELQLLFMAYCPNAQIDVSKGSKIIKECQGLAVPPKLSAKQLEMIFAKVKGAANGGALDYSQFLQFLFYISCIKYLDIDASTLSLASKIKHNTEDEKEKKKLEMSLNNRSLVESFSFGRLTGKKALMTRLVFEYVSTNPVFKKNVKRLDAKSVYASSERAVDAAVTSIQRMFKVIIFRMGIFRVRMVMQAQKLAEARAASAVTIQKYCRRYLGRRRGVRLSQKMYLKYIDNDSGIPFWTNSHLGTSHWVKPSLLRELDCGDGIKLPEPSEQYTPSCYECSENTASCFCDQCSRLYCNTHFSSIHSSGVRKSHDCVKLEMCVECTFQVPTKRCLSCHELYCDTCFRFVHRRGRARLHTFAWVTSHCYHCDERAAHWRVIDSWNGYEEDLYCTVDFWESFQCDPTSYFDPTGQFVVCPFDYTGPTVAEWRLKRDEAESERQKREAYERQQRELEDRKRYNAALSIQRVYRAVVVRRAVKTFVAERKKFLYQRQLEWPERETKQYKLAVKLGKAKALTYDTNKEKVLRHYPLHLHDVVAQCIERKWGYMSELLVPVDLGEMAPQSLDFKERLRTLSSLQASNFKLWLAKQNVKRVESNHEKLRARYRVARSSATAKDSKKKSLQIKASKALKKVDKAKAKLDEAVDSHTFAKHKYEYFSGPRDLHDLVKRRRKTGVPMPFTVDLVYGSRYAVVRYSKMSTGATDDGLFLPRPGRWRSKIKVGSIIKILGIHFSVVEDAEDMLDIQEQLEIELAAEKAAEELRLAKEENERKERLRRERLRKQGSVVSYRSETSAQSVSIKDITKSKSSAVEEEVPFVTELTCIASDDDKKFAKRDRKEFESEAPLDRIKLDRPWLFADMVLQDVHLVTVKPPASQMLFNASRKAHKNPVVQSLCALNVLLLHKRSLFWANVAKTFDEESSIGAFFADRERGAARKRNRQLKKCLRKVNLDYELHVKEKLFYGFKLAYNIPKQMVVDRYERYKLNQQYKRLSPYRRWEKSEDKIHIKVVLESGVDDALVLGFIDMDPDAPLDVARDYIHRNFRDALNDICGSAFCFYSRLSDGNDDLVPISAEEERWSKSYLRESKSQEEEGAIEHSFFISAKGGELDFIDEGNLSDEEDILDSDDDDF